MMIKKEFRKEIESIVIGQKQYRVVGFTAGKLAEMLGVRNDKVSKIMRAEFGMPYAEFVTRLRMKEAKRLLRNEKYKPYTIAEIGEMSGFGNRQTMYDAFHKHENCTPEEYRRGGINGSQQE